MSKYLEYIRNYKDKLKPVGRLEDYFNTSKTDKIDLLKIGKVSLPTGEIVVRDPYSFFSKGIKGYKEKVSPGEYDLELSVLKEEKIYMAGRVSFRDDKVEEYIEALTGEEDLDSLSKGEFYGFQVQSGLVSITDKSVSDDIYKFLSNWEVTHKDLNENIYDNYFSHLFNESFKRAPKYQTEGGNYIEWTLPDSKFKIPIFAAGYGNGTYPVYFGYNKDGEVVELIIQMALLDI